MSENPHIAGKYAIIAAIIAGILPLLGIYLESVISKPDPPLAEQGHTKSIPPHEDAAPIVPAPQGVDIEEMPYPISEVDLPVAKPIITHDPKKSSNPGVKPDNFKPNTAHPPAVKEPTADQPQKSVPSEFQTNKVSISAAAPKLFNSNFPGNIAIVDIDKTQGTSLLVNELLTGANHQSTTSFFRSGFNKNDFWTQGADRLERLSLPGSLKCVCMVKEQVNYEQKERFGEPFSVAKGFVDLKIFNINNGMTTTMKISVGGSGADDPRAYASFQNNFLLIFEDKNYLQKFETCKK